LPPAISHPRLVSMKSNTAESPGNDNGTHPAPTDRLGGQDYPLGSPDR